MINLFYKGGLLFMGFSDN